MMDLLEASLSVLAYWDAASEVKDRENSRESDDDPHRVLPVIVRWSMPFRRPQNRTSNLAEFSPARQAAIEYASNEECVYLAIGYRCRLLPLWKEIGYIGSSGSGEYRLKKKEDTYGLDRMDRKGRITAMYVGKIESRLTKRTVKTASGGHVSDFEVAEHLLIGLYTRPRRGIPDWLRRWLFLPFNKPPKREVKSRFALLINRFEEGKRPRKMPDVIAYKEDDKKGDAGCWWIWRAAKRTGLYWGRTFVLRRFKK